MTNVEFCYWLQGSLEVMQNKFFDPQAVAKIKAHLAMVEYYDTTMRSKSSVYMSFCDWLRGYLEGSQASERGVDTTQITAYLFKLFDHVVPAVPSQNIDWSQTPVKPQPSMQLNPSETSELVRC